MIKEGDKKSNIVELNNAMRKLSISWEGVLLFVVMAIGKRLLRRTNRNYRLLRASNYIDLPVHSFLCSASLDNFLGSEVLWKLLLPPPPPPPPPQRSSKKQCWHY